LLCFDLSILSGFSANILISKICSEQVKVLALTDHDTMSGIPEATEAARRFGIKIIPGVEISTMFSPRYLLSSSSGFTAVVGGHIVTRTDEKENFKK
jgi:hypothetical protein